MKSDQQIILIELNNNYSVFIEILTILSILNISICLNMIIRQQKKFRQILQEQIK